MGEKLTVDRSQWARPCKFEAMASNVHAWYCATHKQIVLQETEPKRCAVAELGLLRAFVENIAGSWPEIEQEEPIQGSAAVDWLVETVLAARELVER